jgi:hypothetical protein
MKAMRGIAAAEGRTTAEKGPQMKTRTKLIGLGAAVLVLGFAGYALTASSEEAGPGFGPPFLRHGMMSHGMAGMGPGMTGPMTDMKHDSTTTSQLRAIHELFANHDRIKRSVTNLPNGIRTETTSDDPQVIQWIKTHVAEMGQRLAAGDDPGLPIESDALHALFRNKDKIDTSVETLANGVVVVQTSADPTTVAALQEHAAQVTEFVRQGMAAVHTAMMSKARGAMHSPMMGGMMSGGRMHGPMAPGGMMHGPN